MADLDHKYVEELLAHLRGGGPFICSDPRRDIVPLLEELQRARPIVAKAREVASQWRAQDGINGARLDELAAAVLGV